MKNTGQRSIALAKIERTTTVGDDISLPSAMNDQAPFSIEFNRVESVEPGQTIEFPMFFAPRGLRSSYSTEGQALR